MLARTKLFISALVAGSALAAAIPAQAQSHSYRGDSYERDYDNDRHGSGYDRHGGRYDRDHYYRGNSHAIRQQIEQLRWRINRTDGYDRISEREAAGLRRAVWEVQQQFRDYNRDGLSHREARSLQHRINWIRDRLRHERHDYDGRRW